MVLPHDKKNFLRKALLVIFAFEFLLALHLPFHFLNTGVTDQFFVELPWLADWNIFYRLGIDGLSLVLILLTIVVMGLLARSQDRASGIVLLLLTACLVGCFSSLDLFLFSIFFQLSLVLIFFLSLHCQLPTANCQLSTILLSSAILLTAILMLASRCDASFNLFQLTNYRLPISEQRLIAGLFILSFLIPVFLVRFDKEQAHTIFIPTLSLYGLLRFALPLLPNAFYPLQSRVFLALLAWLTVLVLLSVFLRQIPFRRRRFSVILIFILILFTGLAAKPVWTLIDRSAETILLYMQSERGLVVTGRLGKQ